MNTTPSAPAASAQSFCSADNPVGSDLVPALSASINWYSDAVLSTSVLSGDALSTGTYYVTTTTSGCEGVATTVSVTVNTTPSAPAVHLVHLQQVLNLSVVPITP